MSIKKRIFKNSLATGFNKAVVILRQLLLVPFFIKYWGADLYGEWLTLTIIPTILAFADFGFGSAASSSMVLAYADKRNKDFADMAVTGFFAVTIMIAIVWVISFGLLQFLSYLKIFDSLLISNKQAYWVILFLMIARSIGFYQQFFEGYFRAAQKAHLSILLVSINTAINLFGSILIILLGGGVIHLAFLTFVFTLLFIPAYSIIAKKNYSFSSKSKW